MDNLFTRGKSSVLRWHRFLTHDIWRIGRPGEEAPDGFLIKQIRVAILLVQNLVQDALMVRAAALTFATVLTIVPFLVIMFAAIEKFNLLDLISEPVQNVAEGFMDVSIDAGEGSADPREQLRRLLDPYLPETTPNTEATAITDSDAETDPGAATTDPGTAATDPGTATADPGVATADPGVTTADTDVPDSEPPPPQQDFLDQLFTIADTGAQTSAFTLAVILFILSTVFGLMRNVEHAFNVIWGVKQARSWFRTLNNYLLIILVLPIFMVTAFALSAILESGGFSVVQYLMPCFAFSVLYFFVPNTRVRIRYAVLGGVVAGALWSFSSWGYLRLLAESKTYGLLYGTTAQVPLLLMWVYLSWVILLLGAELAFAYQNEKTFAMERWAAGASHAYREALGIRAMVAICARFDAGQSGLVPSEAAEEWNVPTRLLNDTLEQLEEAHLVRRCATEPVTYQPARSIARIAFGDVVKALRESGRDPSALRDDAQLGTLLARIEGLHETELDQDFASLIAQWQAAEVPALTVLEASADEGEAPAGQA